MNYLEIQNDIEKAINGWKRMTVLLFRINSWAESEYFQFLDLLVFLNRNTDPDSVFSHIKARSEMLPSSDFYKKVFGTLQENGYAYEENIKLVFVDEHEKTFFSSLYNSIDLLIDGLFFMLLPEPKKKTIMQDLISSLLTRYQMQVRLNYSPKELSLIKTYRKLSIPSRDSLYDYAYLLLDKESR